jgi:ectoine hydroxylase-related dioxygenase (phytanoyl-CoA dioxygenase family)
MTDLDTASLDRDGFVLVPSLLDGRWVERLRQAFFADFTTEGGTEHVRLAEHTPELDAWRALETHPVVMAAAQHLLGRPARVRDLHGRNPLPGYGQQGLHTDWGPRAVGDPVFVVTTMWMFDAFTSENGATRVVPGTHRLVTPLPKAMAQPLSQHPQQQLVTGPPGSALIFNGHLWHSGTRNQSAGPRRSGQLVMVAR